MPTRPARDTLSAAEARRVAIAAQGLAAARPRAVTLDHVRRAMHRLALVQLDAVSVLVPAHYQPLFSRLGPYDRRHVDELVYRRRLPNAARPAGAASRA